MIDDSNLSSPSVCCVVVNWNGGEDTLPCVASLVQQEYAGLRVVVVDNGSSDDSVARIREAFPQVEVIETGRNLGFASGTNAGFRRGLELGAEFFWALNNDTVAPPDTCRKLVAKALAEPKAGVVGSVLYFLRDPGRVQAWGGGQVTAWLGRSSHFFAPTPLDERSYLTFASVLIRREVLLKVGLLYEGYFMYYEDADYALRVTDAGCGMVVAEDTAILHKEGGSYARRSALIDRYYFASGLHFLRRHSAVPVLSAVIFLLTKLAKRIAGAEWRNAAAVFLAVKDYWGQRKTVYRETV